MADFRPSDAALDPRAAASATARRVLRVGTPLAVVAVLGFFIWRLANDTAGEKREVPQVPVVALTPPPPPPPPPPQPKPEPEPQKTVETPSPTPTPAPKPDAPKSDAPKLLTINGPAQAGTDAFGVAAGSGGGLSVGGDPNGGDGPGGGDFGEANYARGLRSALQAAVQSDEQVSRLAFAIQVRIWIDGAGRISRATIARSSGDPRTDKALLQALDRVSRLDPPPPKVRLPVRVELAGRRV